ncbi:hypothetical protein DPMN_044980 [Dreissena polymorpha]|uniref:Uncharacterized protein n=1 Tax=Dreissena polymorpha TaxID=45954 RepID=A0A9D4D391_DREPO|nr:hypothetical protein DPMN_044980 [Dreissena polymorpha]
MTPLQVIAERESVYQLLSQTTPENLRQDHNKFGLDPASRYQIYFTYILDWTKHLGTTYTLPIDRALGAKGTMCLLISISHGTFLHQGRGPSRIFSSSWNKNHLSGLAIAFSCLGTSI